MKIIEVLYNLQNGGAQRLVVDLSNEMSLQHEVVLLTLKDDTIMPERRNFYKFDLSDRVQYENLGLGDGFSFDALFKIYRYLNSVKADVVHIHGEGMPAYFVLPLYMGCGKTKFYQTIHSDLHNGYDTGFMRFTINTMGRIGRLKFVCLSPKNYEDFKTKYPKSFFRCIVNGRAPILPTSEFHNTKHEMLGYRLNKNSRLYLHIASCNEVKNQKLLISSFNEIVKKGINADLVIIGKDYDTERGIALQKMACKRVHFIGQRKNIADYVLNADIFCLSSNYEGMPISLIEASLAGLPAVSTPVCGAVDIIENNVNGMLAVDHTEKEYIKALIYVYENYDRLRENALTMKNNSPYTIKECSQKYISYFCGC